MNASDWTNLNNTIERAKREVLADVKAGIVPATVGGFSELHDHVDANGYGGAFETPFDSSEDVCNFWDDVQDAVDAWIKSGALRSGRPIGPLLPTSTDEAAMGGGPW